MSYQDITDTKTQLQLTRQLAEYQLKYKLHHVLKCYPWTVRRIITRIFGTTPRGYEFEVMNEEQEFKMFILKQYGEPFEEDEYLKTISTIKSNLGDRLYFRVLPQSDLSVDQMDIAWVTKAYKCKRDIGLKKRKYGFI